MGDTLAGVKIKDTYQALIKFTDSTEASNVLKQLSDGSGIDLPFYISIDEAKFSKKLTIQGDGINDILDIKNNAGTSYLKVDKNGLFTFAGKLEISGITATYSTGINSLTHLNLAYTINNTGGTNTITGIKVNATETSITGTTHNLLDLQVGSSSVFKVDKNGSTTLASINSLNSWIMQFTDGGTGFLLFRGANRFKLSAAGTMAVMGNAAIGWDTTTTSARLHVRGDGTNPIARLENSAGTSALLVNNDLSITTGGTLTVLTSITGAYGSYTLDFVNPYVRISIPSSSGYGGFQVFNNGNITRTTGETSTMAIAGLFAAAAGSANYKPLRITYTINNSGAQSGTATGIFLNATETALNSMTHNLMDLQVGNSTKFKISNTGKTTLYDTLLAFASTSGSASINIPTGVDPSAPTDGDIWSDGANLYMRLGGVTKTFTLI